MTKQFGTPGPRAIYPEMCDSPSLGRCGILALALFPRLVAMADDQGRLTGDAYGVLVACLGRHMREVRVDQVEDALQELEMAQAIERYVVRQVPYLQLVSWWHWQSGQRRAYPSRWPAPRGWTDVVYGCAAGRPYGEFAEAAGASSPRNRAVRGIPLQSAADRGETRQSAASREAPARGPTRGPARGACRAGAGANTVPRPARDGAMEAPRGGPMESAGDVVSEFQRLVPRPGVDA